MGLYLQILAVDGLEPIFGVADFRSVVGRYRPSVDVDAGDFPFDHHHAHAIGNSRADRGENEVALRVHVGILVEQSHADGVVEVHPDLNLAESIFVERQVAEGVVTSALGRVRTFDGLLVALVARGNQRNEEHCDRE